MKIETCTRSKERRKILKKLLLRQSNKMNMLFNDTEKKNFIKFLKKWIVLYVDVYMTFPYIFRKSFKYKIQILYFNYSTLKLQIFKKIEPKIVVEMCTKIYYNYFLSNRLLSFDVLDFLQLLGLTLLFIKMISDLHWARYLIQL